MNDLDPAHSACGGRRGSGGRVARVHHDPFEPILPVLEAVSPVGEYRKIADEIAALRPCPHRYPKAAAESGRAFLMIRFGLHLGFRQKNLRQLLVCGRDAAPRSERQLSERACGELRWNQRDAGWATAQAVAVSGGVCACKRLGALPLVV